MIYKIEFDPRMSAWTINLQRYWFFWQPVRDGDAVRTFANYTNVEKWVEDVGLDNVYRNWADRPDICGPQYR